MARLLDSKAYIVALEDLVAKLGPAMASSITDESDKALIAFAVANVAVRHAKQETDRLAKASENAKVAWMAGRQDMPVEEDPNPSDVLPSLEEFIADADISHRTMNVLKSNLESRRSLMNLVRMTEQDLRRWNGVGNRTFKEVNELLQSVGLHIGMTREEAEAAYKPPS